MTTDTIGKRCHDRINAPALVKVDDYTYTVEDWGIGGLKIVGFDQKVKTSDCFPVQLQLNFSKGGKETTSISITTIIEVVWLSASGGQLGAHFVNLRKLEKDLLQEAVSQIHQGELTLLEPANEIVELKSKSSPASRLTSKRVLYTLIYLIIGGVLGFFSLRAVYDSLVNLQIKSAVIAKPAGPVVAPVEPMVAKEQGIVDEFYVYEGMNIKPGEPLFSIKNDDLALTQKNNNLAATQKNDDLAKRDIDSLNRELQLSKRQLPEARANLQESESLQQQESKNIKSYQTISKAKFESARAALESQTAQSKIEKANLERYKILLAQGAVSQRLFDTTKSRFLDAEAQLKKAQSEYKVAQVSISSGQQGIFYDGQKLISDLPRRTAEREKLRQLVQIASQKVSDSEQMLARRMQEVQTSQAQKQYLQQPSPNQTPFSPNSFSVVYKAPFPGSVLKVTKVAGNLVRSRETVMVLQREQLPPTIDAYLTPQEAEQIGLNSRATALIPAINEKYQAHVAKIDRAAPAVNSEKKSVYVQLTLDNLSPEDNSQLIAGRGMPVILNIPKQANLFDRLAFLLK